MTSYTIESPTYPTARVAAFVGGESLDPFAHNLFEVFEEGAQKAKNVPCLGRIVDNKYQWQTYEQVLNRMKNFASGLRALSIKGHAVGLMSVNRPEWVIAEYACYHQKMVTVPIYDTLGVDIVEYIAKQTEMDVIVTTSDKLDFIPSDNVLPHLKTIILMDESDLDEHRDGRHVLSMNAVENMGANKPCARVVYSRSEVATICFTSGTTGKPKGVVLTHGNFIAEIASIRYASANGMFYNATSNDTHLSYLPLAHVFERVIEGYLLGQGASIGFYGGNTQRILNDLALLRPTIFVSVPRIFNRIYNKVWEEVKGKGAIVHCLFRKLYDYKRKCIQSGNTYPNFLDRIFHDKLASKLGGNVKVIVSGSAPLRKEVNEFLRVCFTAEVYEGYGLTETCAGITLTLKVDRQGGHVGVPFACCAVKLDEESGEVLVKGQQIFKEYYKDSDLTKTAFNEDGWYCTGDIGAWDDKGRLVITGRIKETFKLSQGEFICPEKIEGVLSKSSKASAVFVHGDSSEHSLVAIVVPVDHTESDELFKRQLLDEFTKLGKSNGLKGFEIPKKVHLAEEPFTVENDTLTPTMKLKRHVLKARYAEEIKQMYETLQ